MKLTIRTDEDGTPALYAGSEKVRGVERVLIEPIVPGRPVLAELHVRVALDAELAVGVQRVVDYADFDAHPAVVDLRLLAKRAEVQRDAAWRARDAAGQLAERETAERRRIREEHERLRKFVVERLGEDALDAFEAGVPQAEALIEEQAAG